MNTTFVSGLLIGGGSMLAVAAVIYLLYACALLKKMAALREVMEFYGNRYNYEISHEIILDNGKKARAVLERT